MYEVLVVGAGPAGSAAAATLARAGRTVLLIDRATFPRDKPCGDGVGTRAINELERLGVWERVQAANFRPTHRTRSVAPGGGIVEVALPTDHHSGLVAPRVQFDDLLKQHAEALGATFRQAQAIQPLVEDGRVCGAVVREPNGTLHEQRASVVIAADGANSVFARTLRPAVPPPGNRIVGVRGYVTTTREQDHTVHIDFVPTLLPGYAWIFPVDADRANVGVGTTVKRCKRLGHSLASELGAFLALPRIQQVLGDGHTLHNVRGWALSTGGHEQESRVVPGAIRVGDAGAFINPATGAGIGAALQTGRIAAEVVCDALDTPTASTRDIALSAFDVRWRDELSPALVRGYMVQQVVLTRGWLIDMLNGAARTFAPLGQQMSDALDGLT